MSDRVGTWTTVLTRNFRIRQETRQTERRAQYLRDPGQLAAEVLWQQQSRPARARGHRESRPSARHDGRQLALRGPGHLVGHDRDGPGRGLRRHGWPGPLLRPGQELRPPPGGGREVLGRGAQPLSVWRTRLRRRGSPRGGCWRRRTKRQGEGRGFGGTDDDGHLQDDPGEMGNALPTLDFGGNNLWVEELVSGHLHNCVRLSNGQVKCW